MQRTLLQSPVPPLAEPRVLQPRTLARELISQRPGFPGSRRQRLLGIVGAPGSGKSTFAGQLEKHLPGAVTVPMDGFHYPRATLDKMADPVEAHRRRGAPFTFDAPAFVDTLRQIRRTGSAEFPTFDHAEGDPRSGSGVVRSDEHTFVIVEGLYLLLEQSPWDEIRDILDESIFLHVPLQSVCMARVYQRQIDNGAAPEVARERIQTNDFPNGQLVEASAVRAHRVISAMLDTPLLPARQMTQTIAHMPPLVPGGMSGLAVA